MTTRHVFLFEGFGGYFSRWWGRHLPPQLQNLMPLLGPPGLASFVLPLFTAFPKVKAHYLPQTLYRYATRKIHKIRAGEPEAQVALIGYSYGGAAAHSAAHRICKSCDRDDALSLVMTIDPVAKWRLNPSPLVVGDYDFSRPVRGVTRWINFYQSCDRGGLRPTREMSSERCVHGDCVVGADENYSLTAQDFRGETICSGGFEIPHEQLLAHYAHRWIPAHQLVQTKITEFLRLFSE